MAGLIGVLPAQRRTRVVAVGPIPIRKVRQGGRHDRRDDARLDRADRQGGPGDRHVEQRVAGADDAERDRLGGEVAQAFRQRAG